MTDPDARREVSLAVGCGFALVLGTCALFVVHEARRTDGADFPEAAAAPSAVTAAVGFPVTDQTGWTSATSRHGSWTARGGEDVADVAARWVSEVGLTTLMRTTRHRALAAPFSFDGPLSGALTGLAAAPGADGVGLREGVSPDGHRFVEVTDASRPD